MFSLSSSILVIFITITLNSLSGRLLTLFCLVLFLKIFLVLLFRAYFCLILFHLLCFYKVNEPTTSPVLKEWPYVVTSMYTACARKLSCLAEAVAGVGWGSWGTLPQGHPGRLAGAGEGTGPELHSTMFQEHPDSTAGTGWISISNRNQKQKCNTVSSFPKLDLIQGSHVCWCLCR